MIGGRVCLHRGGGDGAQLVGDTAHLCNNYQLHGVVIHIVVLYGDSSC